MTIFDNIQPNSYYQEFTEPEGYGAFDQDQLNERTEDIDLALIDNIEFDDVDMNDYPDFTDAYIVSADYNGVPMTDDELADLNDNNRGFVYQKLIDKLF